jgi:hypothetical protein
MVGDNQVAGARDNQAGQAVPERTSDLTEDPIEEDRAITRGLMILSEKSLASVYENEADIYTVEDLKVRFK